MTTQDMEKNGFRLHYQYSTPPSLDDLALSLSSFSKLYTEYCKADPNIGKQEIVVSDVSKGSIIIDLEVVSIAALPIIANLNTVADFLNHMKASIDWILRNAKKPNNIGIKELEEFSKTLTPIANDSGSSWTIGTLNNSPITVINLNSRDANILQNQIRGKIDELKQDTQSSDLYTAVIMYFKAVDSVSKDKAYIPEIYDRPVSVTYSSDTIKQEILSLPVFKKNFLVNVLVKKFKGIPRFYHILDLLGTDDKQEGDDSDEPQPQLVNEFEQQ